jgi:dipeptidyl aminopeptidase/acylaminoacyl peptidase
VSYLPPPVGGGHGSTVLTTRQVTQAALKLNELIRTPQGLAWLERRPQQSGRTTVVRWTEDSGRVDLTPPDFDAGSSLHGYGGGVHAVTSTGCYVVKANDSHIVHIGPDLIQRPILTSATGLYGDLVATHESLLSIRESVGAQAFDSLVRLVENRETTLVRDDFLAAPTPGPGRQLAWLRWPDSRMPWDGTELRVATQQGDELGAPTHVAGGPTESVIEPQWGPDGSLYFQSDRSGWWNLYRWNGHIVRPVAPMSVDCAAAPWEPGYRSYTFLPGNQIGLIQNNGANDTLVICRPNGTVRPITLPYTSLRPYLVAYGDRLAVIASATNSGPKIVLVDPGRPRSTQVITESQEEPDLAFSIPERLRLAAGDGQAIHVLVYPPTNAPANWRAPLIVQPHPGPTDNMHGRLNWHIQFFTARGYAVAEVDYRGSTGYGRDFRESLYGHWGTYDAEDCRTVATHLIRQGRAIVGQVFIRGESAGGYTALKAISDPFSPFTAAVAGLSIVDPHRWQHTTTRFQRPHATRLIGPAGPVRSVDIRRPVLLMHGSKDTVAPLRDVVELGNSLAALGKPHRLIVFEGAGHGFTNPAQATAALEAELTYYGRFTDERRTT